ncbi:MAG TPA: glucose-6-phosphate dehydrogenase [Chitinivibrionales bacterium]|nr:glucose-6-phosphate dehydrogenase [Chitinivibrionales bacterium]
MKAACGTSGFAIVILGASGNLAQKKLMPALHRLYQRSELADCSIIVGAGRTPFTDEQFRRRFTITDDFGGKLFYHQGLQGLREYLAGKGSFSRVIFFFALPPDTYAPTAAELRREGFCGNTSIIIEKPFGSDVASARLLNRELSACYTERQIFRNDHYLAKEAVQNILVFRFANSLFEPVWNGRHVESIQISACEQATAADRAQYFDKAGIIRDMAQNHLMQLLCLLTMDAPASLGAEDIRRKKISILKSLSVSECRRCQYDGYRSEKGIAPDSKTETFAELSMRIAGERWKGTKIFIRTGKALHRTGTEIGVRLRPPARNLFAGQPNVIVFKIQPAAGIILGLSGKKPGEVSIAGTRMTFCYNKAFDAEIPGAYQKLLLDAIRGDHTLFVGAKETEESWRVLDAVLDKGPLGTYAKGALPPAGLDADWIDFDGFAAECATD